MPSPPLSSTRRYLRLGLLGGVAVGLSACFTTAEDFKSNAEDFITDSVAAELGATFTDVNCVAPVDQQIGTRFVCSAIDANGDVWEFDNVIDGENRFTVDISRRP